MRLLVLVLLAVGPSCAQLPPLASLPRDADRAAAAACRQAFPAQPWRASHTIVATLPLGYNGGLIGVTAAGAEGLHAILLSPEGITLFEAQQRHGGSGGLAIQRAVPPLDRSDFAAGLLADVGSAFLPPIGEPQVGTSATGEITCRWRRSGHEATEVQLGANGPTSIRTYRDLTLTRQIDLLGHPDRGFFPQVRLTVPGPGGYTLDLTLVDHE